MSRIYNDTIEYCKGCRRAMDRFWAFEDEQYCSKCWPKIMEQWEGSYIAKEANRKAG